MIPNLSVIWVVLFVLLLSVLLDYLLFRPVTDVMRRRGGEIDSAVELARASAARAEATAAELDRRTQAAKSEVYREMDEIRRRALGRRTELLLETRREAEASIAEAAARLKRQAAEARARLETDADALGSAVAERVLGRRAS